MRLDSSLSLSLCCCASVLFCFSDGARIELFANRVRAAAAECAAGVVVEGVASVSFSRLMRSSSLGELLRL